MSTKKETKKEETKLQVVEKEVSGFIENAITNKLPVETMEKLFNLRKEVKAEFAKEQFVIALSKFQNEVPIIEKTKKVTNKDGSLRYMYAPMDSVIKQIKSHLAENGFSYTWDSTREEQHIKVVCKLTHIDGHSEQSTFDIPIEQSAFMTSPQRYATAQSYAKRYTLLNVLGIGTADEDTDSTDTENDSSAKNPKSEIMILLRGLGYVVKTKADVEKAVDKAVGLKLLEKNYSEIVDRLEVLKAEKDNA